MVLQQNAPGWLGNNGHVSLTVWRLEVQDQDPSRLSIWQVRPASRFTDATVLPCPHMEQGSASSLGLFV